MNQICIFFVIWYKSSAKLVQKCTKSTKLPKKSVHSVALIHFFLATNGYNLKRLQSLCQICVHVTLVLRNISCWTHATFLTKYESRRKTLAIYPSGEFVWPIPNLPPEPFWKKLGKFTGLKLGLLPKFVLISGSKLSKRGSTAPTLFMGLIRLCGWFWGRSWTWRPNLWYLWYCWEFTRDALRHTLRRINTWN